MAEESGCRRDAQEPGSVRFCAEAEAEEFVEECPEEDASEADAEECKKVSLSFYHP